MGSVRIDTLKGFPQLLTSAPHMLGNDPDVGQHRHYVGIAVPPWNNVIVQVFLNTCPSGHTQVDTDIEAVGAHGFPKHPETSTHFLDKQAILFGFKIADVANVSIGTDEEMSVIIGKLVHYGERAVSSVNDKVFHVLVINGFGAEDAPRLLLLSYDVVDSPRCPDSIHFPLFFPKSCSPGLTDYPPQCDRVIK
jgi:hypothetical protein